MHAGDFRQRVRARRGDQAGDQVVRFHGPADQLDAAGALAHQGAGRHADAADFRIAQQGRQIGRAGDAEAHRQADAEAAQLLRPVDDRGAFEDELGDEIEIGVAAAGVVILPEHRLAQGVVADQAVALGMRADMDRAQAVALQGAGEQHIHAFGKRPGDLGPVSGDDQRLAAAGLAGQPVEEILERGMARQGPRRDMRHGDIAPRVQRFRGGHGIGPVARRQRGDEDPGARRHVRAHLVDLVRVRQGFRRHLRQQARQERLPMYGIRGGATIAVHGRADRPGPARLCCTGRCRVGAASTPFMRR